MKDAFGMWGTVLAAVIAAEPRESTIVIVTILLALVTGLYVVRQGSTTILVPPTETDVPGDTEVPTALLAALTGHSVDFASFVCDVRTILEALSLGPRSFSSIRRYLEIANSGMRAKATSEVIQALVKTELVRSKDGRYELTRKGRSFLACMEAD